MLGVLGALIAGGVGGSGRREAQREEGLKGSDVRKRWCRSEATALEDASGDSLPSGALRRAEVRSR